MFSLIAQMEFRKALNQFLDQQVHTNIRMFRRSWCAFQFWLYTGWVLAIILAITLSFYLGMSPLIITLCAVAALLSCLILAMAIKIITGEEQYVFYQHAIAVVTAITTLLWLLGQPIIPYLALTVLGLCVVSTVGRLGCFMVGCCHGRPSRWGVRYRQEYADNGFPYYYVGVRLLPTQLLESLWFLVTTSFLILLLLSEKSPVKCFTWGIFAYSTGRFLIEFLRGDPERHYLGGFSEAQWTALALMSLVLWAEFTGGLPFHLAHLIIFTGVMLLMFTACISRLLQPETTHQFFYAPHVGEVAEAICLITDEPAAIAPHSVWSLPKQRRPQKGVRLICTSLGLRISAGRIEGTGKPTHHYAISQRDGLMTRKTAESLAKLLTRLTQAKGSSELLEGKNGVFHLLINAENNDGFIYS